MKIKKRADFPKCLQGIKALKGICIGECINDKVIMHPSRVAHSHCFKDKFTGWICLRYKFQLKEKLTLLHEAAHLIANTSRSTPPHGKRWKKALLALGGTYKAYSYTHNGIVRTYKDYTLLSDLRPQSNKKNE